MSLIWARLLLALVAGCSTPLAAQRPPGRLPRQPNHRGTSLVLSLGVAIMVGVGAAACVWPLTSAAAAARTAGDTRDGAVTLAAMLAVFLAGLYDDLSDGPTRGLMAHMRQAAGGRLTSGLVKLVTAVAAGAAVSLSFGFRAAHLLLSTAVVAGAANVWNLLDVRPGRSIKFFLPVAVVLAAAMWSDTLGTVVVVCLAAALAAFAFDLRERAMLGDAGSNVLGLVAGVGLARSLSVWGLAAAFGAILLLHALAETVTLSGLIDALAPLRWFDRLGTIPPGHTASPGGPARGPSSHSE